MTDEGEPTRAVDDLKCSYGAAFDEWCASGEADVWETTTTDGLTDEPD